MRITWVTRSFLDYRIPVFAELDSLCGNQLTVIYNGEVVPERCQAKVKELLDVRAIALHGERRLTGKKSAPVSTVRRGGVRIPLQPGLLQACKKSLPEVCISDGFFQWTYAPLWMRLWHRIPHVMCYEPTKHTERNAQWFRTMYRRIASRWCDAICCNGVLCKEYCEDVLHIPVDKLHLGNMAADTDGLTSGCAAITSAQVEQFRKQIELRGVVFLFVGRLVEVKGLRNLLMAWSKAGLQNATFLCVGDGPQRDELESYCRANGIHSIFVGKMEYEKLPIYYRASDVFVIPTLQDNWSLVVPEAMACGLPVACSQYNGCWPELVKPENGWVFDPLNLEGTASMLKQITACDKATLAKMGIAGQELGRNYSPANAAMTIYASCENSLKVLRQ